MRANRRVVLTGASGFLGSNLLLALIRAGCDVTAISRHPQQTERLIRMAHPGSARVYSADVRDAEAVRSIIAEAAAEVVIHCAAATPVGATAERAAFGESVDINIGGTVSVLEAVGASAASVIVYVSSGVVYGDRRSRRPLRETDRVDPNTVYAITKRSAELLCLRHADLHGRSARVLRVSAPFGPWELPTSSRPTASPIHRWCVSALEGRPVREETNGARDFTYVDDTSAATVMLALAPATRHTIYNIACGRLHRYSDVLASLASVVPGLDYEVGPELARGDAATPMRGPLSVSRLQREFRWRPKISIEEGLRHYLLWLAENR